MLCMQSQTLKNAGVCSATFVNFPDLLSSLGTSGVGCALVSAGRSAALCVGRCMWEQRTDEERSG